MRQRPLYPKRWSEGLGALENGKRGGRSETRLARTLLLLARYGQEEKPQRDVPKVSQATLAEMVGTTRSRVNFFMNKFKRLGFIEYKDGLKIHNSLLTVVLHE